MLQAIAILGGWLLMMGQHDRSEPLFYYFRIEDQVPQNHMLRFIDRYVSFDFVREKLRASYSETGRPSIDPEVLLRILLLGYLYGITSASTYLTKGNRAAELGYFDNYLIDNESCVIVGVQATAARLSQESAAARDMI